MQAAREAARRMDCTNKLKQLALGLQNYHDTNFAFPNGFCYIKSAGDNGLSVSFALLPFCEANALYEEACTTTAASFPSWTQNAGGYSLGNPLRNKPSYLQCPSENAIGMDSVIQLAGFNRSSNYMICGADWQDAGIHGQPSGKFSVGPIYLCNPRSVFNSTNRTQRFYKTIASIVDGTSNTICYSESCVGGISVNSDLVKVGVATSTTAVPTTDVTDGSVSTCIGLAAGNVYASTATVSTGATEAKNTMWHSPYPIMSAFHTLVPPNGPSCANDATHVYGPIMKSASSNHSGGVNAALFDGSVRFISDTIDHGKASAVIVEKGASQFGVWGAMGSINGGEQVSL
ncbi:MAG: DUF1559 domain-containing protein [Planctomycetia bacterium]|nr:DUF1559 domain-containing protein [Planctomycetia bacterium]